MSNNSEVRPDWDHYFMEIAQVVSKRSTCLRRSVGAVIVKNKQILATGYNGTPKGMPHCGEVGCLREQLHVSCMCLRARTMSCAGGFMQSRTR